MARGLSAEEWAGSYGTIGCSGGWRLQWQTVIEYVSSQEVALASASMSAWLATGLAVHAAARVHDVFSVLLGSEA